MRIKITDFAFWDFRAYCLYHGFDRVIVLCIMLEVKLVDILFLLVFVPLLVLFLSFLVLLSQSKSCCLCKLPHILETVVVASKVGWVLCAGRKLVGNRLVNEIKSTNLGLITGQPWKIANCPVEREIINYTFSLSNTFKTSSSIPVLSS